MRYKCKLLKDIPMATAGHEFFVLVRPSPSDKDEFFVSETLTERLYKPSISELSSELFAAFNADGWVEKIPIEESLYEMKCSICGGTKLFLYYDLWIHRGHETRGASIDLWAECVCGNRFQVFKCVKGS